ncbi:ORFL58W, partial [Human betaherpesvirus 5]
IACLTSLPVRVYEHVSHQNASL